MAIQSNEWLFELGDKLDLASSFVNHVMLGALPSDDKQRGLALIAELQTKLELLTDHIEAM